MNDGEPRSGGVLRLSGPGELDHLDPVCSPRPPVDQITRLCTRQLFTYAPRSDLRSWQAVTPVPDLAAQIPSIYNAGVGASYTSYVVSLRQGVRWDTTPARAVTTHDVVRGFKRMCNPLHRPAVLPYFTGTIRGMAEFCAGYAAAVPGADPTADELAEYQNSHDIPGLLVLDDETLVFELVQPTLDFIDILAMSCASPAPVEYDMFVPDSAEFHDNIRSNGPYRPTRFVPGRQLRLERNPVWRQDSDPVRCQHVDAVEVTSSADIRAGEADLVWGQDTEDPTVTAPNHGLGFALDPYLVFNTRSPNANGALGKVEVRKALAYAIDKVAIAAAVQKLGTGAVVRTAGSIIPPGNDGHQDLDPYPTQGDRGDPERCATLLAANCPTGLTLIAIHPSTELGREIARCYSAALAKAGVTVHMIELDQGAYRALLADPIRTAAGEWDIAAESWSPSWHHHNGRVFLEPLVKTCESRGTANYGRYHNPEVDALIEQALGCEDGAEADAAWRKAETAVLADAAIVPILFQLPTAAPRHSDRIRQITILPAIGYSPDLCTVRLDSPTDAPTVSPRSGAR